MNYQHPQLLDELAAHYVLGTLRGAARRRFERLYRRDAAALLAVHRWEDRMVGLLAEVEPVAPPELLWERIKFRVRRESPTPRPASRVNALRLAIAASVAALALALTWWGMLGPGSVQLVANVADAQQAVVWRIEAPRARDELRVVAGADLKLEADRAYELWALPSSGAAPVSLGLMPKRGSGTLQLSEAQRLALAGARKVAVSLEPPGGSPSGAPTGPVLFVADIVIAG